MKFYAETELFKKVVATACKFASAVSPTPDFHAAFVSIDSLGKISVYAQSPKGESCNQTISSLKHDEPFSFFVDAKMLKEVVSSVRGDKMAITLDNEKRCVVAFLDGSTKIPTMVTGKKPTQISRTPNVITTKTASLEKAIEIARATEKGDIGSCCLASLEGKITCSGTDDGLNKSVNMASFSFIESGAVIEKPVFFRGQSMSLCLACCHGENTDLWFAASQIVLESHDEKIACTASMFQDLYGKTPVSRLVAMRKFDGVTTKAEEFFAAAKQISAVKLPESLGAEIQFDEVASLIKMSLFNSCGESTASVKMEGPLPLAKVKINVEHLCNVSRAFKNETIRVGVATRPGLDFADRIMLQDDDCTVIVMGMEH